MCEGGIRERMRIILRGRKKLRKGGRKKLREKERERVPGVRRRMC